MKIEKKPTTTAANNNTNVCVWDPDVKIPKDAKVILSASYEAEKKKKAEAKLRETQGRIW